jgi:hypothetical protein
VNGTAVGAARGGEVQLMATASSNGRLIAVAGIGAFIAGCWMGMGSESAGDPYCVVTSASAAGRPGFAPGQLVEATGPDGCQPGEPLVCGRYEPETGDERTFVSDTCPDD